VDTAESVDGVDEPSASTHPAHRRLDFSAQRGARTGPRALLPALRPAGTENSTVPTARLRAVTFRCFTIPSRPFLRCFGFNFAPLLKDPGVKAASTAA
jgi:hypothetical protein